MDKGTLTSVRKKHQLFRRWLQTRDGQDYSEYKKASNQARRKCRKAKIQLEKDIAKQAKTSPKIFWNYIKSVTTTRSGVSDLMKENGEKTKSDEEKAEALNTFFKSVFTTDPDGDLPDPPEANVGRSHSHRKQSTEDISGPTHWEICGS